MITQPVDGTGDGELGRAQAVDEVAASALPGFLHRTESLVGRPESADRILGEHTAAGEHPVAIELGEQFGGVAHRRLIVGPRHRRPASGGGRRTRLEAAAARRSPSGQPGSGSESGPATTDPGGGLGRPLQTATDRQSTDGREGVTTHLAGPDQLPQGADIVLSTTGAQVLR